MFTWISQLLSMMGFAFAMSFAAYYIQSLGVSDPDKVKLWTGAYHAAGPLAFSVMGPIWGALADRFGRRIMMLRANFAAAVILFLMGCVSSVEQLIALRVMQGVFTGTMTAAMTLIAVSTPKERHGLALGSLQAAVFIGWMSGSGLGGYLADVLGYANTIRIASLLMLTSGTLILLTVREKFEKPERDLADRRRMRRPRLDGSLPVLILILFTATARRFDGTIIPLFVQELNDNRLEGSATMMGQMTAICCVALTISSISMGWLTDRFSPSLIAKISAFGGCAFAAGQFFTNDFQSLVIIRSCMVFCIGGLDPAFQVWLTRSTSAARRGSILGFSVTAKSVGWVAASLGSAYLATIMGIRSIFLLTAALFLVLIPLVGYAVANVREQRHDV